MSQYSKHLFTPDTENNSWSHLSKYIKDNDRVLDVGCSSGNFGESLIRLKKCEVIGIDIDPKDILLAKKVLTKALKLDINNTKNYKLLGKFDVIIFADVIEHLIDPRETLRKVKVLLKNDGKIIFSIPNMAHISVRLQLLDGLFPYKNSGLLDKTHLHFYDREEVDTVFADAGYNIGDMNPVISKITKGQCASYLKRVGLVYSDSFEKYVENTSGYIFQFVGMSQVANKDLKPKRDITYKMPQDELFKLAQSYENKVQHTEVEIIKLEQDINNMRDELNFIKNSISWKLTKPLRAIKKIIKR